MIVGVAKEAQAAFPRSPRNLVYVDWSVDDPSVVEGSPEEIRAAYFKLAKTLHPDRQAGDDPSATERFLEIQQAYEILMDPNLSLKKSPVARIYAVEKY